jgi:hypothetical protein
MDMHLKRHSMQANSTPKVFFDEKVEDLSTKFGVDRHGAVWVHPVSGDILQGIKKGTIQLTRDRKRDVDPMEG